MSCLPGLYSLSYLWDSASIFQSTSLCFFVFIPVSAYLRHLWSLHLSISPHTPFSLSIFLSADPGWGSCSLGVFICLACSGIHRNIPNVSKVKSLSLSHWEDHEVQVRPLSLQQAPHCPINLGWVHRILCCHLSDVSMFLYGFEFAI